MKNTPGNKAKIVLLACHNGSLLQSTPLGVASLCAALPPSCTYEILNLPPDFECVHIAETVAALQPKLIGFSLYVWNRVKLQHLAQTLRPLLPETVFVAGGPEVSCDTHLLEHSSTSKPLFDVVIQGHGEEMFRQLAAEVLAGSFVPSPQLQVRNAGKTLISESPWLKNIISPQRGVLLETARGCPFRCAYCFDARGSRTVRQIPPARVRKELELFAARGVEQVWVLDSSFNVPSSRGKELLYMFLQHAPGLHYHLEAKGEYIDAETAQLLAQLSCSVQVGLQSVDTQVLKNVNRTMDIARFEAGLFELYQHGVTYGIDLIYGLPGDTYTGLCASLEHTLGFYPNQVELFPLALLPGTALEQQRTTFGITALPEPPYTVTVTASMGEEEFARAEILASALDLFYNTGRAVAYFELLCSACNQSGVEFLHQLATWLEQEGHISNAAPRPNWEATQAHELQLQFVHTYFSHLELENLLPAAVDIIRYHYLYAETLLAPPLAPVTEQTNQDGTGHWTVAAGVHMGEFSYPVELYHSSGVEDLVEFEYLNSASPCGALFSRGLNAEVECRMVPIEVIALLRACEGATQVPAQYGTLDVVETATWIQDAVARGILRQNLS